MVVQYPNFLVCVRSLTFNHKDYITDALNGFVMQETNFPYVVCVIDDASTDGTQDVIRQYVNQQFAIDDSKIAYERETDYAYITYAQHKINVNCFIVIHYLKYNHYQIGKKKVPYLSEWREDVKYEALCEGDDYWTDPLKLQKQVDILENNDSYGCVYTGYKTVDVNSIDCYFAPSMHHQLRSFTGDIFSALIYGNFPQTLTILYRRELLDTVFLPPFEIDYGLFIKCALQKDFYFIPSITGAYRINPNGMIQAGDFFRLDIKGLVTYYYIQYLKNKQFRRSLIPSLKIHKAFFVVLCTYSNLKSNFIYFKQIARCNWIIGLLIPIGILRNLFISKLRSLKRLFF